MESYLLGWMDLVKISIEIVKRKTYNVFSEGPLNYSERIIRQKT